MSTSVSPLLSIAVVGLGYWGPNRLRVLHDLANVQVRWICDTDGARLGQHSRGYVAGLVMLAFQAADRLVLVHRLTPRICTRR